MEFEVCREAGFTDSLKNTEFRINLQGKIHTQYFQQKTFAFPLPLWYHVYDKVKNAKISQEEKIWQ
jgi:hypothetical protein